MKHLRLLSSRPTLLRDEDRHQITDGAQSLIGVPGPLGRERVVFALPMAPVDVQTQTVVHDDDGAFLADPDGTVIGVPRITVHRMLTARWTEDTRRLAG